MSVLEASQVFRQESPPAEQTFHSLATHDFDMVALHLARWKVDLFQLDTGPFQASLRALHVGPCQLIHLQSNRTISLRGEAPAGSYVFNPVTVLNADARWRGRILRPGHVSIRRPDDSIDHRTCDSYENTGLVIKAEELNRLCHNLQGVDFESCFQRFQDALTIHPNHSHSLYKILTSTLDSIAQDDLQSPGRASRIITRVVTAWLASLLNNLPNARPLDDLTLGYSRRLRLVRQAEDYLRVNLRKLLTVNDLCDEFDVSARTLAYAFKEITGLSPMSYFKNLKLNHLRQDLKKADPRLHTVLELASRYGLDHPGALAADYRRLFDELPSQTLNHRYHA